MRRSSSRRSRGICRTGGPGGTGGAVARSRSARSAGVRRTGAAGCSPGGHGSTSLPSTGLTVSRRSCGYERDDARLLRCLLTEIRRQRIAGRTASAGFLGEAAAIVAELFRPPVYRVHRQSPQDASSTVVPPGLARPAVASGPVSARWVRQSADGRTLNLRTVSTNIRGAAPPHRSRSREDCAASPRRPGRASTGVRRRASIRRAAGTPRRFRPRWPGCGAAGWPPAGVASAAVRRGAPAAVRRARLCGARP